MSDVLYETERLLARAWREADRDGLAALNADPEVMRYFPARLSRSESDDLFDRIAERWREDGYCFPAVERKSDGALIGFVGLSAVRTNLPFGPTTEIGWRLARRYWRQGYAAEAADAALAYGFETLDKPEIVSFTTVTNEPSQAVMRRIGMVRDPAGDFDHPLVPASSPIRPHVLYRLSRRQWRAARR